MKIMLFAIFALVLMGAIFAFPADTAGEKQKIECKKYVDEKGCTTISCTDGSEKSYCEEEKKEIECKSYLDEKSGCETRKCTDGSVSEYCKPGAEVQCKSYVDESKCIIKTCKDGSSSKSCPEQSREKEVECKAYKDEKTDCVIKSCTNGFIANSCDSEKIQKSGDVECKKYLNEKGCIVQVCTNGKEQEIACSDKVVKHELPVTKSDALKANVMKMQYEKVSCRAEFYKNLITRIQAEGENYDKIIAAEPVKYSIDSNTDALKEAAENGNKDSFNSAIKELRGDVKDVARKYIDVKQDLDDQDTKELSDSLQKIFIEEKQKLSECLAASSSKLAEAQLAYMQEWTANAKKTAETLKAKGVDTTEMENAILRSEQLSNKIETALRGEGGYTSLTDLVEAVKEEHYQIWAQFQLYRIDALTDALVKKAEEKGQADDINAIKEKVKEGLEGVKEGSTYHEEDFKKVKNNIKEGSKDLKELFDKIKE